MSNTEIRMIINQFKRKIMKGFDTWANTYSGDVFPKLKRRGYSYEILAKNIIHFFNPPLDASIVELGTGTGILGAAIKALRPDLKIIGFDISSKMLRQANSTGVYNDLFQCDSEIIPVKTKSFLFVYTAFMFHSVFNPEKCLVEFRRIGEENCRIVLVDLFRSKRRIPYFSRLAENIHSFRYEYGAPSRYHSVQELVEFIDCAGLKLSVNYRLDACPGIEKQAAGGMIHQLLGCVV